MELLPLSVLFSLQIGKGDNLSQIICYLDIGHIQKIFPAPPLIYNTSRNSLPLGLSPISIIFTANHRSKKTNSRHSNTDIEFGLRFGEAISK